VNSPYGVATISRLLKIKGLFCKRALQKRRYSAKETYNSKDAIHVACHACYGVATISRLLKIVGLFCRISSLLLGSFAEETYNFEEPTNRSHPVATRMALAYVYIAVYIRVTCTGLVICVYSCWYV